MNEILLVSQNVTDRMHTGAIMRRLEWENWRVTLANDIHHDQELISKVNSCDCVIAIVSYTGHFNALTGRLLRQANSMRKLFLIRLEHARDISYEYVGAGTYDLGGWNGDPSSSQLQAMTQELRYFISSRHIFQDNSQQEDESLQQNEGEAPDVSQMDDKAAEGKVDINEAMESRADETTNQISLGEKLDSLQLKPSNSCNKLFYLCRFIAGARFGSSEDVVGTDVLLFALAGVSTRFKYGFEELQKYKDIPDHDISIEFSNYVNSRLAIDKKFDAHFGNISELWSKILDLTKLYETSISANFGHILETAAHVASAVGDANQLYPEHLLAALIYIRGTSAHNILKSIIPDFSEDLREHIYSMLAKAKTGDSLEKWRAIIDQAINGELVFEQVAANEKVVENADSNKQVADNVQVNPGINAEVVKAPVSLPELISAHYAADTPDADDLIGVEHEAKSFARYIAKKNLSTPLAIGLFGDWGSGKTFFMHKMQKFVEELQGKSSWCDNIVQIEFNAWHYIESNLWASLVEHIFAEMDKWLNANNKQSTIDDLYKVFESAQEVQREAQIELERAQAAQKDAQSAFANTKKEYEAAVKQQRQLSASDIWTVVTNAYKDLLKQDQKFNDSITQAGKILGVDELSRSAGKLHEVVTQAGDVAGRSKLLLASLFSRKRNAWQYGVIVMLLAVAPLLVGLLWSWGSSSTQANNIFQTLGAGAAQLSALISVIAGWGAMGLRSANKALVALEKADTDLKEIMQKESREQQDKLASAESAVAALAERLSLAEQRMSQATDAVDKARQRLEAETPRARLTRFLRRRLDNEDYSKHLGVISMIRKDFELLSGIMTGQDWTESDQNKLQDAGVDLKKARAFDRIILYIDDLDRCPAERVVEVLQAVHLLLAFPLFVVVVGVDARWVSRALSMRYQYLLGETVAKDLEQTSQHNSTSTQSSAQNGKMEVNDSHGRESLRVSELIASSHDYLEKIFQVPYWVKPMDTDSSREFIEKLARSSLLDIAAAEKKKTQQKIIAAPDVKPTEVNTPLPKVDNDEDKQQQIDANSQRDPAETEKREPERTMPPARFTFNIDKKAPAQSDIRKEVNQEQTDTDIVAELTMVEMPLTDHEILFMKALAPNIGRSPRRSKRFFNVYQLVRAGLSVEERDQFVGKEGDSLDYRVLMCLLAIVTGSPILAPRFFEKVVQWNEQGKSDLAEFIQHIATLDSFTASLEYPRLSGALDELDKLERDDEILVKIRHWTRRAMRFSFTARPV